MSTDIELAGSGGLLPAYMGLADRIAKTEFVPKGLRGRPEAVLACILHGHEVGMGPMQSLSAIDVIEGKPTVKPEAMRGLVRQAGHKFWVEEKTNTRVTVAGSRRDDPDHPETVTWTIEDARAAGLASKEVWKKYPRSMLLARATAELCRSMFSDVVAGLSYTPEEVDFSGAVDAESWEEPAAVATTAEEPLDEAFDREPIGVMLDRLDDEGKGIARERCKAAKLPNWKSPALTKTQAHEYAAILQDVEAEMKTLHDSRRGRVFASLAGLGLDKDETLRHAIVRFATHGLTDSTGALTVEQTDAVVATAGELAADRLTLMVTDDGEAVLVPVEDAGEGEVVADDEGREF